MPEQYYWKARTPPKPTSIPCCMKIGVCKPSENPTGCVSEFIVWAGLCNLHCFCAQQCRKLYIGNEGALLWQLFGHWGLCCIFFCEKRL